MIDCDFAAQRNSSEGRIGHDIRQLSKNFLKQKNILKKNLMNSYKSAIVNFLWKYNILLVS